MRKLKEQLLGKYYSLRANEYEQIYFRPEPARQEEISEISELLQDVVRDRSVLEVACGTGYWTAIAAQTATKILATDISEEMLKVARGKKLSRAEFRICDAYFLDSIEETFEAGLSNFWLSHVPKAKLTSFLEGFHARLDAGARVFIADNVYIPGVGGELIKGIGCKDSYKLRRLSDGSEHKVLKNYYDEDELRDIFSRFSSELMIKTGNCYWWISYRVK
jgi:SAM-dependent methyltransferase